MPNKKLLESATDNILEILISSISPKIINKMSYYLSFPFDKKKAEEITRIKIPLILISQVQRSGGTLLSQLFDNHRNICAYPSELLICKPDWPYQVVKEILMKKISPNELLKPGLKIIKRAVFYGYKKSRKSGENNTLSFNYRFDERRFIFNYLLGKTSEKERDIFDAYFTSFFYSWKNYNNQFDEYVADKKYITAFSPRTNINLSENNSAYNSWMETYLDGFLISLIRNPLDWLASAKLHSNAYENVNRALDIWYRSTKATIRLSSNSNVIPILFSDLINDTATTMKSVCNIVDISYSNSLTIPTFNGNLIKSNSSFHSTIGKIDGNVLNRQNKIDGLDNLLKNKTVINCIKLYDECLGLYGK